MNSLHSGVIAFILLFPYAILAVTIVGQFFIAWVRWVRSTSINTFTHPRVLRACLQQVSGGKATRT